MTTSPEGLLTRRQFGGRLLHLGLASAGIAGLARAETPPAEPWTLGCYTRPFDQYDLWTALDAIAEAGFRHCGIMTAKGKSWVVITADTSAEEAARVGAEIRKRGLGCLSVYGDYPVKPAVAENVRALQRLVEHCAACGSPDLLLGGTGEAELQAPYYDAIREVGEFAAARRVRLTIKPHGGFIATGPQCRAALERVNHPNFRLWYDPGNIYYYSDGARDPVTDAASVDGLVVGMSAKDYRDPKDVMVTPGTGRVDFRAVLARLRRGGFTRGPILVETVARGELRQVIAEARRAREFLEALTREVAGAGETPAPR
jgi:sugar phosphate isomerase/epimerase